MNNIIDKIIIDLSLDSRISDGIFDIKNNNHIQYLCEYLVGKDIDEDIVYEFIQPLMEKGKFPERQAFNRDGLLVTFPTPAYKQRALKRGTHFEKDPRAAQSNLFGGGQKAPNQPTPAVPDGQPPTDTQQSSLPPSDSNQPQTPPEQKEVPEPGSPGTPAAPPPAPSAASAPSTQPPAQGQLATEPIPQTTAPNVSPPAPAPQPKPVQKTPQEIEIEKQVIKTVLNSDDTLPTVAGVGGSGITEELKKLIKVAMDMDLNEAAKFLSKQL